MSASAILVLPLQDLAASLTGSLKMAMMDLHLFLDSPRHLTKAAAPAATRHWQAFLPQQSQPFLVYHHCQLVVPLQDLLASLTGSLKMASVDHLFLDYSPRHPTIGGGGGAGVANSAVSEGGGRSASVANNAASGGEGGGAGVANNAVSEGGGGGAGVADNAVSVEVDSNSRSHFLGAKFKIHRCK